MIHFGPSLLQTCLFSRTVTHATSVTPTLKTL